jgi:hypothetical protein
MEKEEVELIERIQGGDKMAFGQLMERYGERVMSMGLPLYPQSPGRRRPVSGYFYQSLPQSE